MPGEKSSESGDRTTFRYEVLIRGLLKMFRKLQWSQFVAVVVFGLAGGTSLQSWTSDPSIGFFRAQSTLLILGALLLYWQVTQAGRFLVAAIKEAEVVRSRGDVEEEIIDMVVEDEGVQTGGE